MGVVFRARDHNLKREVAVKVLKDRYSPESKTAARFVEEAEITAQLQHPGIPAVYHVAKYPDGRPFLAMKLIKGETLDSLIKSNAPINRLAVFEAICQALGYAHAHDVIHRDLKPANVMVGAFGEVQVMDWGLAKVLKASREAKSSGTDADETTAPTEIGSAGDSERSVTQPGSVMGTPAYMPPEQAAGEIEMIDQRSDVFGLGAILCVLLTGQPPYSGQDSLSVQLKAVRGETQDALARLDACAAEPGVVALCKQCLGFKPTTRPADANAVAQIVSDLRREAEDRARQAELDKAKAEVFAAEQRKRRRVWLGLAAALLVGVCASSGLAAWANHARGQAEQARQKETEALAKETAARKKEFAAREKAEQAERDENKAKKEAVEQAALATGVKDYLLKDLFELGDPGKQQQVEDEGLVKMDPDLKVRDVIVRAAQKIEGKFTDQPLIEAQIRGILGHTLLGLGQAKLALAQFVRQRQLYTQNLGSDHPATLANESKLATSYASLGRHLDALKLREETLAKWKRTLGPDHPATLASMSNLAGTYYELGLDRKALKLCEETLTLQSQKFGPDHPATLATESKLALILAALGRHPEALKLREETLAKRKQKLGPDHPTTLASMSDLAASYAALGRHRDALKLREQTLTLQRQKLGPEHPDTFRGTSELAACYAALGQHVEALRLCEETLILQKRKLGPDHPDTITSMNQVAGMYFAVGRYPDALRLCEEIFALEKQRLGPDHPDTLRIMHNLAGIYVKQDRAEDALKLRKEILALRKQKLGSGHPDTVLSMRYVVESLVELKRSDEAVPVIREVFKLAAHSETAGRPDPKLVSRMVTLLMRIAVHEQSAALARESVQE